MAVVVIGAHVIISAGFLPSVTPTIALGLVAGFWLDQFINPTNFRKLVLALLVVIGIQLVF